MQHELAGELIEMPKYSNFNVQNKTHSELKWSAWRTSATAVIIVIIAVVITITIIDIIIMLIPINSI